MAERTVGTNTRKKLINNEPFAYAHLVKFERPSATLTNGTFSTDAKRYAYFTDASHNISFDDLSNDTLGNNNGTQTYIANKLLDVGTYSETIQARASGMSITVAAESLNNAVTSSSITMTSSTITVPTGIDLVREGFREGDKVFISGGTNSGHYVKVTGIKSNNTVLNVSNIDNTLQTQSSGTSITLSIVSDELQGPLGERNLNTLQSYANRDVFVYKAFLDPDDGTLIDSSAVLIFKGIITTADIVENPSGGLRTKWGLTSHWGDFSQVKGRPTNDAVHRALDNNNRGQPLVTTRPEYANDLGFIHAEETINILATYTTIEQETKYRTKQKWYGKVKTKEVITDVEVENDVDLSFSLTSKYLPVVYGVQRISGIPIFVDTKSNDPNNIFIAYALCEGEIGGLYDLYIDGNPVICLNKEDSDDRNQTDGAQKEQINTHCRARADLGQTLGGKHISGPTATGSVRSDYPRGDSFQGAGDNVMTITGDYIPPHLNEYYTPVVALRDETLTTSDGTGVQHEETVTMTTPNNMSLTLHTGKIDQNADNHLVAISVNPLFKRQQDYYSGAEEYWGPNHRLLDTAYVVMDCEIGEDATTVPEVEYVVRGKNISSYNYDFSYAHSPSGSGESQSNFNVGDVVDLHRADTDAVINDNVFIIDKWNFVDPDGNVQYRFRFSTAPSLSYSNGVATIKEFYMKNSSNQKWTMATWDYTDTAHSSGTVPSTNTTTVSVTANTGAAPTITMDTVPDWINDTEGVLNFNDLFPIAFSNEALEYYKEAIMTKYSGSGSNLTLAGTGNTSTGYTTGGSQTVISKNTIKLASGASSTDDAYNDFEIILTKSSTAEDGSTQLQTFSRTITDYDGGTKIATVNSVWDNDFEPVQNDTYELKSKVKNGRTDDARVSINPAIQLLDYMSARRYGKDLDIHRDINLSEFLTAARTCDARGTQTLAGGDVGSSNIGERYVLTSDGTNSGSVVAMGLVESRTATSTTFQEVFGKFTKKFMKNSYSYLVGDIIYTSEGYYRVTTAGTKATAPTGTNPTGFTGPLTQIPLYKISVSGDRTRTIDSTTVNFSKVLNTVYQNPATYSLYDSDDVKYWRYYGWDDKHQRFVTRHQTQGTVRTSDSVFENVNGFLQQFNGLLAYEGGKYSLKIETTSDTITSTVVNASNTGSYSGYTKGVQHNPRVIDETDIIGNITVKDKGTSKSYNTVSASIMDPANKFKGRAVSFYNSDFLRADKNVIKSGQLSIPSVANYYNARINVENFLRKSRYGLTISFTLGPKSLLLLAGDTISVTNSKLGFTDKIFRISNINYQKNCNATITATEYDDSFYTISPPSLPSVINQDQRQGLQAAPPAPSSLSATANNLAGIKLSWTNGSLVRGACWTEIYVSSTSNTADRVLLTKVPFPGTTFDHALGEDGLTRYYWIRHGKIVTLTSGGQNKTKELYSAYVGSVNATTVSPSTLFDVILHSDANTFSANSGGTIQTPNQINLTSVNHNLSGSPAFTTSPSVTLTGSGDTRVLTKENMGSNSSVVITSTVTSTTAERSAGADNTYTDSITISRVDAGAAGSDGSTGATGATGPRTVVTRLNFGSSSSSAPTAPTSSNTNTFNFSTATFSNILSGWSHSTPTYASGNTNKYWYIDITVVESSFGGSQTLSFGAVTQAIGFSGLVTFSNSSTLTDGSTTFSPIIASQVNENVTSINGSVIQTGTIAAARISISGKNVSDLTNDSGFTTFGASNVQDAITNNVTSISGSKITTGTIDASQVTVSNLNAGNITAGNLSVDRISANSLDISGKAVAGSVGEVGGTSGQNSTDNSQNIEITELVRFIYGDNNKPKHIVGTASTTHNPNVSVGDVMGGSPRFNHNFTTHNFSGTKDYIVSVGLDFLGSSSSSTECIFAVAMRATSDTNNFTSQTESDYIFTDKIASAGSHALGPHVLNAKVSLSGNTQYYIWCFALGDDGCDDYKSGFINVFGLND